ncbi:hypothetical protein LJC17_05275 [Acholeplasma sp. OttesenSCG-928-E16]|nr:hypothetical protein [Acholeplasma sp. OttesenSCG-928-E16]
MDNNNNKNENRKAAKVVTKNDILLGSIALFLILVLLAFFVIVSFDLGISDKGMRIAIWILLAFLFIGGGFLIFTHLINKDEKKKKGMFIGGIIVSFLALVSMVFHALGWI